MHRAALLSLGPDERRAIVSVAFTAKGSDTGVERPPLPLSPVRLHTQICGSLLEGKVGL